MDGYETPIPHGDRQMVIASMRDGPLRLRKLTHGAADGNGEAIQFCFFSFQPPANQGVRNALRLPDFAALATFLLIIVG